MKPEDYRPSQIMYSCPWFL